MSVSFSYDHLTISDDQSYEYGVYCGLMTGHTVIVNGSYVLIRFHSDDIQQEQGFVLVFTAVVISKCAALNPHRETKKIQHHSSKCFSKRVVP